MLHRVVLPPQLSPFVSPTAPVQPPQHVHLIIDAQPVVYRLPHPHPPRAHQPRTTAHTLTVVMGADGIDSPCIIPTRPHFTCVGNSPPWTGGIGDQLSYVEEFALWEKLHEQMSDSNPTRYHDNHAEFSFMPISSDVLITSSRMCDLRSWTPKTRFTHYIAHLQARLPLDHLVHVPTANEPTVLLSCWLWEPQRFRDNVSCTNLKIQKNGPISELLEYKGA